MEAGPLIYRWLLRRTEALVFLLVLPSGTSALQWGALCSWLYPLGVHMEPGVGGSRFGLQCDDSCSSYQDLVDLLE